MRSKMSQRTWNIRSTRGDPMLRLVPRAHRQTVESTAAVLFPEMRECGPSLSRAGETMRRVGQTRKRDWNEAAIVSALEGIGIRCVRLSAPGCPDLLAYHPREGFRLLEVKQPRGRLTEAQQEFDLPFTVVRSVPEALAIFGVKS